MKKKTAKQEVGDCRKGIIDSVNRQKFINENGCNDPSWTDGCNMNLVRNHILYYKKKISEICGQEGFVIPEEYYIPTPPEVDNSFMANLNQKERVERLSQYGNVLTTENVDFDEAQLSLF